jgi:hypothetical protein
MGAPAFIAEPLGIEIRDGIAFIDVEGREVCCMPVAVFRTTHRRAGAALACYDAGHGVVVGQLRIADAH